jgi:hypothetical protein
MEGARIYVQNKLLPFWLKRLSAIGTSRLHLRVSRCEKTLERPYTFNVFSGLGFPGQAAGDSNKYDFVGFGDPMEGFGHKMHSIYRCGRFLIFGRFCLDGFLFFSHM